MLKESIQQSSKENIPSVTRTRHKKWMTNEILQLMDERRRKKENIEEYKQINSKIKDMCTNAKQE